MKLSKYFFSILLSLTVVPAMADSIFVTQPQDTILIGEQKQDISKYDQHMRRYRRHWASLIPTQFVIQNAGNMGTLSAGFGWNYGKRKQWETHLLFGFIPKHQTSRVKMTMTLKENFIPWSINLGPTASKKDVGRWSLEPLTTSIYLNTVFGHEFWKSQPNRYPDKYYEFMSTKLRLNVAIGQRVTCQIPSAKRKKAKSISLFYEVSSCDLYIRSMIQDHSVSLKDILGLSIGLKFQTL